MFVLYQFNQLCFRLVIVQHLRKTRSRHYGRKSIQHLFVQSTKKNNQITTNSSLHNRFHEIFNDLKRSWLRFSSYTVKEFEPICQQLAIQQMSPTTSNSQCCPLICIFCQNLIYEPITLYCGHTFCNQCIKDESLSSTVNCPRCPQDIQGQIQSSVVHGREQSYKKNRFLKELLERPEELKIKRETILLCHKGQIEYYHGNYQKAIDIYSQIIDQCKRRIRFLFLFLFYFILILKMIVMIILHYIIVLKHMELYNAIIKLLTMQHVLLHLNLNGLK